MMWHASITYRRIYLHLALVHCLKIVKHTCQLSVIGTESPSFSSRQNLRPRRPKSPSFEHVFFFFFRFPAIISYFPVIIPISVVGKKQGWRLDEVGRHVQEIQMQEKKKKSYKAHFNPDWVKEWPALIAPSNKGDT